MIEGRIAGEQARLTAERGVLNQALVPLQAVARFGRRKPLGAVGRIFVLPLVLMAVMDPVIAPYEYREPHPKLVHEAPNNTFLLGTDHLGRDELSRIIKGAQISLYVGLGSVLKGVTGSFIIGVGSAYAGGIRDR